MLNGKNNKVSIVLIKEEETESYKGKEKHGLGFSKLIIHTTKKSTDLTKRFRTLSTPQDYLCSTD